MSTPPAGPEPRPPEAGDLRALFGRSSLFREAALQQQASPDRLDALIQVTRPTAWLALLVALALIAGIVAWGFLGHIPVLVTGKGLLLHPGGLWVIPAPSAGQVSEISVDENDFVKRGQLLARILPLENYPNGSLVDVLSPYSGQVAHVNGHPGITVQAGETLLEVARSSTVLAAVLYLPIDEGKKVHPGMRVRVTPSNINAQRDGCILGTVARVDRFASSTSEMKQLLGSDELVKVFQQGNAFQSAPLRVDVELERDSRTISGLRWTSNHGPAFTLEDGTVCTAEITTSSVRPIDLVLPYLQDKLGGESR